MNPVRLLFPKARRPVTLGAVAPLAIFGALFAGGCVLAEWRGLVRFSYRPAFALGAVLPWVWWLHHAGGGGLSRGRAVVALFTRFIMIGAFLLLLAEPRAVRRSDTLAVIYALDVSDSMGAKVRDQALGWIMQTATQKPPKDEAGLVVFGNDAAVELPPRQSFPFEAINSRVARDGTDLGKALSLAAAMLPEEHQGRIVLLSDGNETEGSVLSQLDELKSRGIAVDVLPVGFAYEKEVWIERLDLPRVVKAGETYEATVLVNSLAPGKGTLRLSENGKSIFEKEVKYEAGKSRFTLPLYLREPGYYEYAATIEVPEGEDGWKENNIALGDIYLRGEGQVLVVTDGRSDTRDWEPLVAALKASERLVQVRMGYELPRDAPSLLPFDLIIFANAPADAFDAPQLQAVHDAVYNLGTGFIMLGGPHSFGPGGYHRTPIEELLPVEMDVRQKKVLPKGALAIILHTCEFPEGNTWAKRMAKEAMRVLGAQDEVGLIAYDWGQGNNNNGYNWIFPLTPASEFERLAPLINKAEPGDMPDFQTPMQLAFNGLKASDAALKHLIVISDGDPSPPTPALIQQFMDAKVSVSMIAINPHGGADISIMQSIAQKTGGRYYFPQDPSQLPAIFIKEAKTLKRAMLQDKVFTPQVEFPSPILKGIDATPPLRGYVLTTAKPRSSTVLRVPPSKEEPDQLDPLLSTWRFGLGASAAWTSDLGAAWAQDWVAWEKYRAFVKQLAQEVSRVEQPNDLRLSTFAAGGSGVITVEDFAKDEAFLEIVARVSGPRGENFEVPLRQSGPRRYQAQFPLSGKGRYQVIAAAGGRPGKGQTPEQVAGGFAVPYSPEYLRFRSDPILLQQIAARTGGRILSSTETDIYHPQRQARESTRPIFDWFLIVLACLLPIDVAVRRVQLDWMVIRGWFGFGKKAQDSTETMGALLGRKKRVQATLEQPVEPRPAVPIRPASGAPAGALPRTPPKVPPATTKPTPPADETAEPQSTTERLLARKRKRDQDKS